MFPAVFAIFIHFSGDRACIKDYVFIDMACGTGGMLSTTHDFIRRMNPDATVRLFGQENNEESYAICLADMLIKGQSADNIRFQDTMKADCFERQPMRFVIANAAVIYSLNTEKARNIKEFAA